MSATAADTFAALCRLLDDGDDSVLPLLADWFEEQGDLRAAGLRDVTGRLRRSSDCVPLRQGVRWLWWCEGDPDIESGDYVGEIEQRLLRRLPSPAGLNTPFRRFFASRSTAFLALADALAETAK